MGAGIDLESREAGGAGGGGAGALRAVGAAGHAPSVDGSEAALAAGHAVSVGDDARGADAHSVARVSAGGAGILASALEEVES